MLWTLLALGAAAVLLTTGCGNSGDSASKSESGGFAGATVSPRQPAQPLTLDDYRGRRVSLTQYRGKAVLVTFIYTHCPDVCPLIVGHLKAVRAMLGPEAQKLQIIAVSTDPVGDTPKTVSAFLRAHAMTGGMDYLIGNRHALGRVWKRWGIAAKPSRARPELVEHSALVYGISASGKITTLYAANFKPAEIVHDVPKLAAL
jgi:protein SCO1/2